VYFMVDHAEPKAKIQAEQVSAEDPTNLAFDQGKPRCIQPPSLSFIYNFILVMILECALDYKSWIDTLVALGLLSSLSLWTILLEIDH
jgi:hypothetical protein